jgi:hypothetical protein
LIPRPARWALAGLLLLSACAGSQRPQHQTQPVVRLGFARAHETIRLSGELRGAFPGVGPRVALEAWIRADGRARVDLRSHDGDDRPTHEVLLWAPESCLLFDAVGGRFGDLGTAEGSLEALGNVFRLRDAVFLLCGRDPVWPGDEPTEFLGEDRQFRGVRGSGTLRRDGDHAGLRWRADDDVIHDIEVRYEDYLETGWGPWPQWIEITGTDLAAAAHLQWTRIDPIVIHGDSIFDPLWEPAAR